MTRVAIEVLADENVTALVTPLDLPAVMPNYFMANWQSEVSVEEAWSTDITSAADSGGEERLTLVDRPYRSMSVQLTATNRDEVHRLWMNITRLAHARGPMPLYSDHARVNAAPVGAFIFCDTTNRRFYKGARAAIHTWVANRPASVEYHTILDVQPNYVRLTSTPVFSYGVGDRIVPIIDVEISLESSGLHVTREKTNLVLNVSEVAGQSALPPTATLVDTISDQYFEGDPIFVTRPDWETGVRSGVVRVGRSYGLGRGHVVQPEGPRPQQRHELQVVNPTRGDLWEVKRFVDQRRGRGRPLWFLNPANLYELVGLTSTFADITAVGNIEDLEDFIEAIGFEDRAGAVTVARIASVTDNTTTWRVIFVDPIVVPASTWRCSSAHHVRFASDALKESWTNDEVSRVSVSMLDALTEEDVEFYTDDGEIDTTTAVDAIADLYFWVAAHKNAKGTGGELVVPIPITTDVSEYTTEEIRDVRDTLGTGVKRLRRYSNTQNFFTQFTNRKLNNGFGFLHSPALVPGFYFRNIEGLESGEGEVPWGFENLGFTAIAHIIAGSVLTISPSIRGNILEVRSSAGGGVMLSWRLNSAQIFDTAGVTDTALHVTVDQSKLLVSKPITMILRIEPNVSSVIYIDGELNASAATPVTDLPLDPFPIPAEPVSFSQANLVLGIHSVAAGVDDKYGVSWYNNELLLFSRALAPAEMNTVGEYLSQKYGSSWTTIV